MLGNYLISYNLSEVDSKKKKKEEEKVVVNISYLCYCENWPYLGYLDTNGSFKGIINFILIPNSCLF